MKYLDYLQSFVVGSGSGGGGGYPEPTGTKQITANGNNIDVKDYALADVNVAYVPAAFRPISNGYTPVTMAVTYSISVVKTAWNNKDQTTNYRIYKDQTIAVGSKVALQCMHSQGTFAWTLWGTVKEIISYNAEQDVIHLETYDGLSYQQDTEAGETWLTADATYQNGTKNMKLYVDTPTPTPGGDCPFLPPASEGYTEYQGALMPEQVPLYLSDAGEYVGSEYGDSVSLSVESTQWSQMDVDDQVLFTGTVGEHVEYEYDEGTGEETEIRTPAGYYALWGTVTYKEEQPEPDPYDEPDPDEGEEEETVYYSLEMTVGGVVMRPYYGGEFTGAITNNGPKNVYGLTQVTVNVPGPASVMTPGSDYVTAQSSNNISYANLQSYWNNKNTTVKYRIRKNTSVVVGGKVAIKYSDTWCMWGVVGTVTEYSATYWDVTLSQYDGFAYQNNNNRSGETHITKNGTYTNSKNMVLDVATSGVTPSGTININANGTYDVTNKATAVVNVGSGGISGAEVVSGTITTVNDNTLTKIRDFAFAYCQSLTSAVIGAKEIKQSAFSSCSALTTVDLTYVGSNTNGSLAPNVFSGCSALTALILRQSNSTRKWVGAQRMLDNTPVASGTGYIYVPSALLSGYQSASYWSTYAAQFRALESYTVDGTVTGALDPTKI